MRFKLAVVGSTGLLALALAGCPRGGSSGGFLSSTTAGASSSSVAVASSSVTVAPASAAATLVVRIISPANGAQIAVGTAVALEGAATGAAGAAVPASALEWLSSIDGPLGTGPRVAVRRLTPGIHRLRLSAVTAGASGEASVLVLVGGPGGLGGQQLVDYLKAFPTRFFGNPMKLPPDARRMLDTNKTDVNGVAGNGGLSATFSSNGTLTGLHWPSPSYWNQVAYVASPSDRDGTGSIENMGAFAGLSVELAGRRATTWFRDATWTTRQSYRGDDSAVLVTEHESAALGLRVRGETFVHPHEDVLVQHWAIARDPRSPVNPRVRFLYYENLSPCTTKIPYLPLFDVYFDLLCDFACGYHQGDDALVHFCPKDAWNRYGALLAFAAAPHANLGADVDAWIDSAGARFGPGVYFAIGGDLASSAHQVGFDAGGAVVPLAGNDVDAYEETCKGTLSGSPLALVRANAALARDLDLASGSAGATFFMAAADLPDDARARLRWARSRPYADHLAAVEQDSSAWLARARLPRAPADARTVAFAKRSLLVARSAVDRNTGAIVASLANQPPYALDWPRDGAFINHALDVAGYPEIVEKHCELYARVQRSRGWLAGTYDMNFYGDGMPAGPIPLEIDETAFAVWTMWDHATFIADPVRRAAYLARVYPAIRRATEFLVAFRDPLSGLQLPAEEDDNALPSRGLHGAAPIHLAIESAIAAGQASGETAAVLARWAARRDELAAAIDRVFWDRYAGAWTDPTGPGSPIGPGAIQATAWVVWPVRLRPASDPRTRLTATSSGAASSR